MQLGSHIAVAVVQTGSCSSDLTPGLGTSICHTCGPKKKKQETQTPRVGLIYSQEPFKHREFVAAGGRRGKRKSG